MDHRYIVGVNYLDMQFLTHDCHIVTYAVDVFEALRKAHDLARTWPGFSKFISVSGIRRW